MTVAAISIGARGFARFRPAELGQILDALPGSLALSWRVEIEDLLGGEVADGIAREVVLHRGRAWVILDGDAMRAFADDITQLLGGELVGYLPGAELDDVASAVASRSAFEASPVRYIVRNVRGDEWIVIARDEPDLAEVAGQFSDVRSEDAAQEFHEDDPAS